MAGHVAVKPVVGLTTELILTDPAKLKPLDMVTDSAAPEAPELKFTGLPAIIMKSPT